MPFLLVKYTLFSLGQSRDFIAFTALQAFSFKVGLDKNVQAVSFLQI